MTDRLPDGYSWRDGERDGLAFGLDMALTIDMERDQ